MLQPRIAVLLACGALTILLAAPTSAQPSPGKISGTVRVASGAPVAGAPVTVMNQETGATRVVRSSSTGAYEAAGLPPGLYTVSADVQGFRKVVHKDQRLAAGATLTVDFTLEVKASEEVTVTAMKREDTVARRPSPSPRRPRTTCATAASTTSRAWPRNVAGFSVQNLGPGQSQVAIRGVSSGQIARDQPGVKEQVGAYLDESVISLSLFTPDIDLFDVEPRRGAARPAGHAVRLRLAVGHGPLHQQPARARRDEVVRRVRRQHHRRRQPGRQRQAGLQRCPWATRRPCASRGTTTTLGGYMDAVQPNLSVKKDVNTGDRFGVRAAIEIAPSERLTITPRIVYQKVEDGRLEPHRRLQHPGQSLHDDAAGGDARRARAVHPDRRALHRQVRARRPERQLQLRRRRPDLDHVLHRSRHPRRARRGRADLQHHRRQLSACPRTSTRSTRRWTTPRRRKVWTQELRFSGGKDRFKWVAGGFYADIEARLRPEPARRRVRGRSRGIPTHGTRRAQGRPVLLGPELQARAVRALRRGDLRRDRPLQRDRRACATTTSTRTRTQIFDGIFGDDSDGTPSCRSRAPRTPTASRRASSSATR